MTKKLPDEVKKNRKPISRACKFCHSKHLQCDPGRPCQNCEKRGLASSCENVERKKTRYLNENEKRKPRAKVSKEIQIKKKSPPVVPETVNGFLISKPSDLNFVNYTGDHLGKSISATPLDQMTQEKTAFDSHIGGFAAPRHGGLAADTAPITNGDPASTGIAAPSYSPPQQDDSSVSSSSRNYYHPDATAGYLNTNRGNENPLQARRPEEHMFYNQSPSVSAPASVAGSVAASVDTGSAGITPSSHHPASLLPHQAHTFSVASSSEYTPLQQQSSLAESNANYSDSSSSEDPEIRANPLTYHADTLDDVINKDDLNFMLKAYNNSIRESKAKFKSELVNDEYAQLTSLLTTNPPSPSDFFDFEINERPYIQLGDGEQPSSEKTHNSIHINTSITANSPDILPNYIQEEHDYTSPLILRHIIKTPDDIYLTNVVKSYQYPKAYHALIHYLKQRFNRAQLLTIAKCMAVYRPSFISATKSLFENDLIFTEKSFQRSLLEYENLISLSATPTIIWRRTGEIAALTNEFGALTGYSRVNLLSKRTFIVEIMDDESALRYFKLFSDVAFGDLNATILTDCVVKKADPAEGVLKCASVWTIKRDVFDIPMLIVGQFLPIL